jgi:hypothetical protein
MTVQEKNVKNQNIGAMGKQKINIQNDGNENGSSQQCSPEVAGLTEGKS